MKGRGKARRASLLAVAVLAISLSAVAASAQAPAIEPDALAKLEKMTKYPSSLPAFSVRTQNVLEEVLESEQKIQYDYGSVVTVKRPNKLRAERAGDLVDQVLTYDGKKLAIHNRDAGYYAVVDAPADIDALAGVGADPKWIGPPRMTRGGPMMHFAFGGPTTPRRWPGR